MSRILKALPTVAMMLISIFIFLLLPTCHSGTPAPPKYYHHQLVDHINPDANPDEWSQRYYIWDKEFLGPGSPILMILGGEGAIEPTTGLFYPFVTHHLAKDWGAFVLEPEHRFYGMSQPISPDEEMKCEQDPRVTLLTPEQALYDAIRLVQHIQDELHCSKDRFSPKYCPVITVGGSYPGFLSAMARVMFPHVIDMAYAASAPMKFYSQQVDAGAYYDHISKVADKSLPGCANGVRNTLDEVAITFSQIENQADVQHVASMLGVCSGSVPDYITPQNFQDEVFMMVGYTFANDNMGNYPPDERSGLYHSCQTFLSDNLTSVERVKTFLVDHLSQNGECFNMTRQLPTGPNATISSGDWSGVGTGHNGEIWDFQTCTLLVEAIGFSNSSMFPPRAWTMDWLKRHCDSRFGVTPDPYRLVDTWRFDDLRDGANASKILFTNGLNDGWSVGGILSNLSGSLLALNFENGAHHSDLSGKGPSEDDTDDIRQGFEIIRGILSSWIKEIRGPNLVVQ